MKHMRQCNSQVTIIRFQLGSGYGQDISHIQDRLFDHFRCVQCFSLVPLRKKKANFISTLYLFYMLFFPNVFALFDNFSRIFQRKLFNLLKQKMEKIIIVYE